MIYIKALAMGMFAAVVSFILTVPTTIFVAERILSRRVLASVDRTRGGTAADFTDIPLAPALIVGGVAFAGGFYWRVSRTNRS